MPCVKTKATWRGVAWWRRSTLANGLEEKWIIRAVHFKLFAPKIFFSNDLAFSSQLRHGALWACKCTQTGTLCYILNQLSITGCFDRFRQKLWATNWLWEFITTLKLRDTRVHLCSLKRNGAYRTKHKFFDYLLWLTHDRPICIFFLLPYNVLPDVV